MNPKELLMDSTLWVNILITILHSMFFTFAFENIPLLEENGQSEQG